MPENTSNNDENCILKRTVVVEENRGYAYMIYPNPNDVFHIDNNENTQVKTREDLD